MWDKRGFDPEAIVVSSRSHIRFSSKEVTGDGSGNVKRKGDASEKNKVNVGDEQYPQSPGRLGKCI